MRLGRRRASTQDGVNLRNYSRTFTDGGGHALGRAGSDVADGKYTWQAGLQLQAR
jgi:hypothetical protein